MKCPWPRSKPFCPWHHPAAFAPPQSWQRCCPAPAPPLGPITAPSLFSPRAGGASHSLHPVFKISTPGGTTERFCGSPPLVSKARYPLQSPQIHGWWQGLAGGSQTPDIHPAGAAPPRSLTSSPEMSGSAKKLLSPCPSKSSPAQNQPSTGVTPDSPCWS